MKILSFENDIEKRRGTETYIVVGEQDLFEKMRETKIDQLRPNSRQSNLLDPWEERAE